MRAEPEGRGGARESRHRSRERVRRTAGTYVPHERHVEKEKRHDRAAPFVFDEPTSTAGLLVCVPPTAREIAREGHVTTAPIIYFP
jgi:hypothetical protein